MDKKRLGKGFEALFSESPKMSLSSGKTLLSLGIDEIRANPYQPRQHFDDEKLQELAQSIREHGVAQPLIVRKMDTHYELIAGERRWRAAKLAGLDQVPVLIKEVSDSESLELAIIENVQREDLNPLEEAVSYRQLMREFGYTQEKLAEKIGKSRPVIANGLRLLDLPEFVQQALREKKISSGHARALLSIKNPEELKETFQKMLESGLNVREVEAISKKSKNEKSPLPEISHLNDYAHQLSSQFGTKVLIHGSENSGSIKIEYFSRDDLERLLELLKKVSS